MKRRSRGIFAAVTLAGLAVAAPARAHPGVGIVMDRRGNVFYTDLARVWKIGADGRKTVAVASVHTHELWLDHEGSLYGEHLWYEGDATKRWGYRVWRRSPDGTVTDVLPARSGFRSDYSFVRDAGGASYWFEREHKPPRFRKRSAGGVASTLAECASCRDVRWMTAAADGTVYFVDRTDLHEISPAGVIRLRAAHLGRRTATHPQAGDRHIVMGLWTDGARGVYAAIYGAGEVKRIAPDGRVTVVARSRFPWSPSGGMIAPNGDLWILEYSVTNAARARRIEGFRASAEAGAADAHGTEQCRLLLDGATAEVERALQAFETERPDAEGALTAARDVLERSRRARSLLETSRVGPVCEYSRSEELIYLNHLVAGLEGWLAARTRKPPVAYDLSSIIGRARTHRERGRASLR